MAKHYVDNQRFYTALLQHKIAVREAIANNKQKPRIPEYIGACILEIATRLSTKPNFINYPHRQDMIMDGVENCITYLDNFDPDRYNNPFAYFTQIIYYAFLRKIQKEKKQLYIKQKAMESYVVEGMMLEGDEDVFHGRHNIDLSNDYMNNLVQDFETKQAEKKSKKAKKKKGVENFYDESSNSDS